MTQRRNRSEPVIRARLNDARILASLLRPIAFTKFCQVIVSSAGLQVVTELNGVIQATAYVGRALFDEFDFKPSTDESRGNGFDDTFASDDDEPPVAIIDVSLERWLMCLNIYGQTSGIFPTAYKGTRGEAQTYGVAGREQESMRRTPFSRAKTAVDMVYVGHGHPLSMIIKHGEVVSKCELATFVSETSVISDMPYVAERTVGQIIMSSKELTEALMSIDSSSREITIAFIDGQASQNLTLSATQAPQTPSRRGRHLNTTTLAMGDEQSRDMREGDLLDTRTTDDAGDAGEQMMRISAIGDNGSTELDFPHRNRVFESFSIKFASKHTYAFANVQHCFRALQTSIKTSVRIDDQGMMSMQCLFPERPAYEQDPNNDSQVMPETENRGFIEIRMLPAITDEDL